MGNREEVVKSTEPTKLVPYVDVPIANARGMSPRRISPRDLL